MAWLYLVIAGAFEVVWAVGIKYCQGAKFSIALLTVIIAMTLSVVFLALATRTIPMSVAYAVRCIFVWIFYFKRTVFIFKFSFCRNDLCRHYWLEIIHEAVLKSCLRHLIHLHCMSTLHPSFRFWHLS